MTNERFVVARVGGGGDAVISTTNTTITITGGIQLKNILKTTITAPIHLCFAFAMVVS